MGLERFLNIVFFHPKQNMIETVFTCIGSYNNVNIKWLGVIQYYDYVSCLAPEIQRSCWVLLREDSETKRDNHVHSKRGKRYNLKYHWYPDPILCKWYYRVSCRKLFFLIVTYYQTWTEVNVFYGDLYWHVDKFYAYRTISVDNDETYTAMSTFRGRSLK